MKIKKIEKIHYDEPIPVYDVIDAKPAHNFVVATNSGGVVAHNCAFIDEINFAKSGVKDIQKAKRRIKELYDVVVARVEGTFRLEGVVWGKIFAVSSKKSDQDFLEDRVRTQIAAGNKHLLVFDEPQWEILPEGTFSKETFYIAIGDKHKKGFVVENDSTEALHDLEVQGYKLLKVPVDMKTNFISDFDVSLRDLAGISVPGALSFITQSSLDVCIGSRQNPFYQNILEIGTKDSFTIEEFFHMEVIPQNVRASDWFIHLDLSLNEDKTGIGASCITGRKDVVQDDGKTVVSLPFISHVFSVSIKAPAGDKIPYSKILNFLCWLRKNGYHIELITRDQYQSEYIAQLLEDQGFKVEKISLDRTPDGYIALRSVLLEERIDLVHNELLENELILLQRDALSGKVDHPIGGCFTDDTLIQLADRRILTIKELMKEQEYKKQNLVYTVNEQTGDIEIKIIEKIFETKSVDKLIKLTFIDDSVVECTPEHLFMLEDGSYVEAQQLTCSSKLKSLNFNAISKVEIINKSCKVYDLTIVDNHNFALGCGVFVHNSKDSSDALAGSVWSAVKFSPGVPINATTVSKAIAAANAVNGRGRELSMMRNQPRQISKGSTIFKNGRRR